MTSKDFVTIQETMTWRDKIYHLVYSDADSFDQIPQDKWSQVYGVCFTKDGEIILGKNKLGHYNLLGGTREAGESVEQTLIREIQEESNTKVLSWLPIGHQYVSENDSYQLRAVCLVEPLGMFESDPAGSVSDIKYIKPDEFDKYIHWDKIGKRLLQRAIAKIDIINK